jgi:nucleotide-binding universal stress UspA family protein
MFKNILLPVPSDGLKKIDIKKIIDAIGFDFRKLTLAFVSDAFPSYIYAEYANVTAISEADYRKACNSFASKLFAKVGSKLPSIDYETCHVYNINVADGIVNAAKKSKADLIAMPSHKRAGLAGVFLGSETHRVILSTKIPVLVV